MIRKYIETQGELKILDFLLRNKNNIYNMKQIGKESYISYGTTKYSIQKMIERKLIQKAYKSHKSYTFRLNTENKFIQSLLFHFESLEYEN